MKALGIILRGGQLPAEVAVLGAQALAELDELLDLRLQRIELGLHGSRLSGKFQVASRIKRRFCMYCMTFGPTHEL
jgi:hypothetical protein